MAISLTQCCHNLHHHHLPPFSLSLSDYLISYYYFHFVDVVVPIFRCDCVTSTSAATAAARRLYRSARSTFFSRQRTAAATTFHGLCEFLRFPPASRVANRNSGVNRSVKSCRSFMSNETIPRVKRQKTDDGAVGTLSK